jgi:hypothetical protein
MACSPPKVIEKPVPVISATYVPEYLLSCPPVPLSNAADPTWKQSGVAAYVATLHDVATECRTKLLTTAGIVRGAQ